MPLPAPAAPPRTDAPPGPVVALPADPAAWPGFVASLKLTGMAAQLAAQTELKAINNNALTLALPVAHKHLADKVYADKLKLALEQATGRRVLLAFEVGAAAESSLAATETARTRRSQGQGRGGIPRRAVRARPAGHVRRSGEDATRSRRFRPTVANDPQLSGNK